MKLTCGLTLTLPLLLVLLLVVATKGHTVIECYVCDNCEKVNKLTAIEKCGGENYSTTTTKTTTTTTTSMPSTTTSRSSTSMESTVSTARPSTENPITTTYNTTFELVTQSPNGLPSTTINPPNILEERPNETMVNSNNITNSNASATVPPTFIVRPSEGRSIVPAETGLPVEPENITEESHNRQRRHTEFNGITYSCYKIQKKNGDVFSTKRGCIGVKTERSACDELDMNNNNKTSKCTSCTETLCNGSSALGVSIATLLFALLAVIYKV